MRLAVISDEVSQDLGTALALIRRHAFQGIEIRSLWNTCPQGLSIDQCERARDEVHRAGVELVAYDSVAFKHAIPRSTREHDMTAWLLETSLGIARALGSPPMRVFSFYRTGPPLVEDAADAMARALDRVPCAGVPLLLENGTRTNSPTAVTLARLLRMLAPRTIGALWDPGNAAFCGMEDTHVVEAYDLLRHDLRLLHVKDPKGSIAYTRLGSGDVPWGTIIAKLIADRFSGYVSLETHWRPDRVMTQSERDEPWGEAFSFDGYTPSSICMALLREMANAGRGPTEHGFDRVADKL